MASHTFTRSLHPSHCLPSLVKALQAANPSEPQGLCTYLISSLAPSALDFNQSASNRCTESHMGLDTQGDQALVSWGPSVREVTKRRVTEDKEEPHRSPKDP